MHVRQAQGDGVSRVPLAQTAAQLVRERAADLNAGAPASTGFGHSTFGETAFEESTLDGEPRKPRDPSAPGYVGGIEERGRWPGSR